MRKVVAEGSNNPGWREKLAVHEEDISVQHRRIAGLIDSLTALVNGGAPEKSIIEQFHDLVSYMELHFSDEEEFMRRGAYPMARWLTHSTSHEVVLAWLRTHLFRLGNGRVSFGPEVPAWLAKWLREEEMPEDEEYLGYFREQ